MLQVILFVSLLVAALPNASALKDIPERARGGRAYAERQQPAAAGGALKAAAAAAAQSWQAPVDHFDAADNSTFAQRFFVDDEFWTPGEGPVFFEISGEGTLTGPPGGYVKVL